MRQPASIHRIVLEVELAGDAVRHDYARWAEVEDLGEHRCRVTMDADSFLWPTHIVTALDVPFSVNSPLEFEQHLAAVSRRLSGSISDDSS